jgi:hypothetical protein
MYTHRLHIPAARRVLGAALAGALAVGALAGPAMAAGDDGFNAPECRKAGEKPMEYLTIRKAGGDQANASASSGPENSIIAVLRSGDEANAAASSEPESSIIAVL